MSVFEFHAGTLPLIVSFPHDGTFIPSAIEERMTAAALRRPDTDWHVARLYDFVEGVGASTIVARASRYVVDLNRDPSGTALYPGADNTGLCPTTTFDREPIYRDGEQPSLDEIKKRAVRWFVPYHDKLREEVERLLADHGVCVLFDAHSIRSEVPRFFEGTLPDLNLGTADGKSAVEELAVRALRVLGQSSEYSAVRDARFRGGYITRNYGDPSRGISALQLELCQKNYMNELYPFEFDPARATRLRVVLRSFVKELSLFASEHARA